jgi:hypothetical protein
MVRFLSHVFKYLDRFYVKRLTLPELSEARRATRTHAHAHAPRAGVLRARLRDCVTE